MTILTAPGGGHTRQPQYPARINWSSGILDRSTAVEVMLPSVGIGYGVIKNAFYPTSNTPPIVHDVNSLRGIRTLTGSESISLASDVESILSATKCTYLILRQLNSLTFVQSQQHGYSLGANRRAAVHLPYIDGTIYWDFGNATAGSGRISVAQSWQVGVVDAFAFVAGPIKGREIWRNGVKIASDISATASRALENGTGLTGFQLGAAFGGGENDETIFQFCLINDELSDDKIKSWSKNPWQILQAPPRRVFLSSATVQLLRPASDISAGAWTPSTGVSLFGTINETPADDATYNTTPSASTFEVKLGAGISPGVTTGHIARYRAKGTGSLTVRLIQGTTVIATNTPSITAAYQTFSFTLSGAEAAAITDYTDLRLRFTGT